MKNLLTGLRKFSDTVYPNQKKMFSDLSKGQSPHTLMITCSDSRIDPNLVTQTSPGEIFVVRNAGNIVPAYGASKGGEEAAIEYAIEVLGVKHIVICGHSFCGAMSALISNADLSGLPSVKIWLSHAESTKRRCQHIYGQNTNVDRAIEENILVQAENLKTHPAVSAALRKGTLDIFGWIYHFETGAVSVYDPKFKKFTSTSEVKERLENDIQSMAL